MNIGPMQALYCLISIPAQLGNAQHPVVSLFEFHTWTRNAHVELNHGCSRVVTVQRLAGPLWKKSGQSRTAGQSHGLAEVDWT